MMSDYGVLGASTVSHLPSSTTLIDNQQQQLRSALESQLPGSYVTSQRHLPLSELSDQVKDDGKFRQLVGSSPSQEQQILNQGSSHQHHNQPGLPSYQLSSSSHHHFSHLEHYSYPSAAQSQLQQLPQLQQQHHAHQQTSHPPSSAVSQLSYTAFESDCNRYNPLRSPNLSLTSSHHQPQPISQSESIYTPGDFHPDSLVAHSDHAHPSPTWSQSQHGDPLDLRHRSISMSTPISTKALLGADGSRNYHFNRLLTMPYQLETPEPVCSSMEGYHLSSFGLPNLDSSYNFSGHQSLHQSPRITHPSQPHPRKVLHTVTANEYQGPLNRLSSPSGSVAHALSLPGRLPSSPSGSFPSLLPSQFSESASVETIGQKRKSDSDCLGEPFNPKVQKTSVVNSHGLSLSTASLEPGHQRMTTILCLHASVAQKSYGQEKRFLCPPPLVRITGPYRQLSKSHRPILSMSILNEDGQRHLCQTSLLGEEDSNVHFKSLHISGAAKKAKHVNLELSLHPPLLHESKHLHNLGPEIGDLMPPFATFKSSDCSIISKPSKKTAKARNTQSCIFNGSTICLFNRINSQTVRTKYLCIHEGQLAARAAQWSAFMIRVVRRAEDAGADGTPPIATKTLLSSSIPGADRTVTYGSEVELVDFVTGVSSGPLVVRKVDKNKVQKDATGPVSQMQKLAFCQVNRKDGSAVYISALEGVALPTVAPPTNDLDVAPEILPTHESSDMSRISLKSTCAFASPSSSQLPRKLHMLQLQAPRAVLPAEDREGTTVDEIDDSVAWTVIGVAHFSHSFIDLSHHYPQIPSLPITPFPALACPPKIDLQARTMSLKVIGFFDAHAQPMEIWLGPIGALAATISSTSGLTLEAGFGDIESSDIRSHSGLRLQMSSDISLGWSVNRKGVSRESSLLVTLPPLDHIYSTLHRKHMSSRAVVMLDETTRPMSELVGREGENSKKDTDLTSASNHIPALPITLIRADGMSFVMGHSICLCEISPEEQKENQDVLKVSGSHHEGSQTFVLKVI